MMMLMMMMMITMTFPCVNRKSTCFRRYIWQYIERFCR